MYSYTYDKRTGGILLNFSPTGFSKEPRPVYLEELNILGFNKFWKYANQNNYPYMWAEANNYYYKGTLVAKLKGGNLYTAPEIIIPKDENGQQILPELDGKSLEAVDIEEMIAVNREVLEVLEQSTVKKILNIYTKYKKKLDCFHVAFSGGKDSLVLLDLVKKALPNGSFIVIFGDTGMEFPDTYDTVMKVKDQCSQEGIPFYIAKSHLDPQDSWKMFGPPSRTLRWCCSVHKSTPQTIKLREVTGKNNYSGLAYVGVRAHESIKRSEYEYFNDGKKTKGQYSHNSILEWTSAEVWMYIYANNLIINDAYKKGNSRAGCLLCPMSGGNSDYLRRQNYTSEVDSFIKCIESSCGFTDNKKLESYITGSGWNARKNGRDLVDNLSNYREEASNGKIIIKVNHPATDWKEWIKTIGELEDNGSTYYTLYNGNDKISIRIVKFAEGYSVSYDEILLKQNPQMAKLIKQVFRKAAYCKGCKVCEANCKNGCISFIDKKVKIENCIKCHQCHAIDSGCLAFNSLRHSQGGGKTLKSLNSFTDHAPKNEWLKSFFELKEGFFTEHLLGPAMFDFFRRFLRDAGLNEKNHFTQFAELICNLGWESEKSLGIMLINLASENPQFAWYINTLDIGYVYERTKVREMLLSEGMKEKSADQIIRSFKRIVNETSFGSILNFGHYVMQEKSEELVRTKCNVSDSRVVMYGLFKFAEKCNDFKEFTLATLMNDSIERDGISPTKILGLERKEMIPLLLGLSARYPDFINVSFTHDLDRIALSEHKTSQDVLELFKGDN